MRLKIYCHQTYLPVSSNHHTKEPAHAQLWQDPIPHGMTWSPHRMPDQPQLVTPPHAWSS